MAITSYAQNFEDIILWRALRDVNLGNYIDIGTHEPIRDSVSMLFHQQGWKGIHVEPVPTFAEQMRVGRPRDIVIEAAVGPERSRLRFWEIAGSGLSTASEAVAETHHLAGYEPKEISVECIPLDDVFERSGMDQVHWMKIDVEGYEPHVLRGWRAAIRPWILVIETMAPNSQVDVSENWEGLILEKGYSLVYEDGLNRFYLHGEHSDLRDRFHYPPNIFDDFALLPTNWLIERSLPTDQSELARSIVGAQMQLLDDAAEIGRVSAATVMGKVEESCGRVERATNRAFQTVQSEMNLVLGKIAERLRTSEACDEEVKNLRLEIDRLRREHEEAIVRSRREHRQSLHERDLEIARLTDELRIADERLAGANSDHDRVRYHLQLAVQRLEQDLSKAENELKSFRSSFWRRWTHRFGGGRRGS